MMNTSIYGTLFLSFFVLTDSVFAARYLLPHDSNIIGEIQTIDANPSETLIDVARRFDVGYYEMQDANPDIDMWVPKAGQKIVLPLRHVVPDHPVEGVVINLPEMRLYYFPDEKEEGKRVVYTFPIGIGREGWDSPLGLTKIIQKKANPTWTPPESIRKEHAAKGDILPKVVQPGPDNPLGSHALRLAYGDYLIHGTNNPPGIGLRVSHGCIQMFPEDVSLLFDMIKVGTPVTIINQPLKLGYHENKMFLEVHLPVENDKRLPVTDFSDMIKGVVDLTGKPVDEHTWNSALKLAEKPLGYPLELAEIPHNPMVRPGYFLQLGEFHSSKGAKQMAIFFAGLNVSTMLSTAPGKNKTYCRVLAGPFSLKKKAEGELRRIKATTGIEGQILPKMVKNQIPECVSQL